MKNSINKTGAVRPAGKFLKEFRTFAMRGNVIDMAIGVVVGGAFGKIVSSLVNDIIMPLAGLACGGIDISSWKWTIRGTSINYGNFLQTAVDFAIIAFSVFIAVRMAGRLKKSTKSGQTAPAQKSADVVLLEEIRDLIKEKGNDKPSVS